MQGGRSSIVRIMPIPDNLPGRGSEGSLLIMRCGAPRSLVSHTIGRCSCCVSCKATSAAAADLTAASAAFRVELSVVDNITACTNAIAARANVAMTSHTVALDNATSGVVAFQNFHHGGVVASEPVTIFLGGGDDAGGSADGGCGWLVNSPAVGIDLLYISRFWVAFLRRQLTSSSRQSRNRRLADVVAAGNAALWLARVNPRPCFLLLMRC